MRFKNLQEMFLMAAARHADKTAFRYIAGGRVSDISFAEIPALTYSLACALKEKGLKKGDNVVLYADNSPDWVLALLAALRLGATVVPVDARLRAAEMKPLVKSVKPSLILTGARQHVRVAGEFPGKVVVPVSELYAIDGTAGTALPSPEPGEPALIVFTSGSQDDAKGVVLSHANILSNVLSVAKNFAVTPGDRLLSVLPLSHMLEFTAGLCAPFYRGATIIYSDLKGPSHLRQLLKVERISVLLGTPLLFKTLLSEIDAVISGLPRHERTAVRLWRRLGGNILPAPPLLRSLHDEFGGRIKFWLSGGAHTPSDYVRQLAEIGIPLYTGYGLSEASPIVAANNSRDHRIDSVGKLLSGVEVRIDKPDADGQGEVTVRGANVMTGYWNDPRATRETLVDGWLHTGDLGRLDSDGYLYITGRKKSVIVTAGGLKISAEEIEQALTQGSAIKEACVFARQGQRGEEICAALVVEPVLASSPDMSETVRREINLALAQLADYKRLADYQIWEQSLPLTSTGKIRRGEVARLYEERNGMKARPVAPDPASLLDDQGLGVCRVLASVMDPSVLRGINPSGSHVFHPSTSLAGDLAIDSFARLELALRLEQVFGAPVPEEYMQDAQTVDDVVVMVKRCMLESASASSHAKGDSGASHRQWRPWPKEHFAAMEWPMLDDPFVVAGRRLVGVGLKVFAMIYNQLEVNGQDRLMIDPPYIIAANHTSHFDTVALLASFPSGLLRFVHPVAAADYFFSTRPRAAFSSYVLNAVPFDRHGDFEKSLGTCETLLRQGQVLIIFPEGARSPDGQLQDFKPGVAKLALAVGCPIIPAYIEGTHAILARGEHLPKPEKLGVTYGLPIYPPSGNTDMKSCLELTKKLRSAIEALQPHLTGVAEQRA